MAFADPIRVAAKVFAILRRPSLQELPPKDIDAFRVDAGMEILRAIAKNNEHGHWATHATLVSLNHDQFVPAHDGAAGKPLIVPFPGAQPRTGVPAEPDEIDSYRLEQTDTPMFTGGLDGIALPHDQEDPNAPGMPSPVSCLFSLKGERFKFTGYSAQLPLIQLTRSMADTGVPEAYEPSLVKSILSKVIVPGHEFAAVAPVYARLFSNDLIEIGSGQMHVLPVPSISAARRQKNET